ncbi:periodic tryptophan protein, partial [Amylocystis lapponica]
LNMLTYAPDSQHIATGGGNGKITLWATSSSFCFITFTEHIAPASVIAFANLGSVVVSASLDGSVRTFNLVRFHTIATPTPVQFSCLTVDPAGSTKSFEVFLWSVQIGCLLDVLAGHTTPV